jgi:hypothetical protein
MNFLEREKEVMKYVAEIKKKDKEDQEREAERERIRMGLPENRPQKKEYIDNPYTMEDGTATFLYIVVMILGTLFQDRMLIYVAATVIWLKFVTRHGK